MTTPNYRADKKTSRSLDYFDQFLKSRILPLGLFIQLTGLLWVGSNGGYITQTYIWCLFPGLLSLTIDLYKNGFQKSIKGTTAGERILGVLFLWILINPLFTHGGMELTEVFDRVLKVFLYMYVVRTVVIHLDKPEKILLLSAAVASAFALATMVYQFGVLERPIGLRALGVSGFRVSNLGIGEFANMRNPILAALYYGAFSSILCGYLSLRPFKSQKSQRRILALLAVGVIGAFILLSGSRGPLMAFIAMGGMALMVCQHSWKRPLLLGLSVTGGIVALIFQEKISVQFDHVVADGFNCRFTIWNSAIMQIQTAPWIGHGAYADFSTVCRGSQMNHQHNIQLNLAYNWGIPAALLYMLSLGHSFLNGFRLKNSVMANIATCLLTFGLVGMLTDTYSFIPRPNLQWLLYFLPVALLAGAIKKNKYKTKVG